MHNTTKFHFFIDQVSNGEITLTYRKTWDQLAVVFTNHSKFKNENMLKIINKYRDFELRDGSVI